MIYIKESSVHGLGVFTSRDIKEGELVDESGSIISRCSCDGDYMFKDNRIIFSKCSLINSGIPNIRVEHEGRITRFYAIKNIKKDEELLLKYGGFDA